MSGDSPSVPAAYYPPGQAPAPASPAVHQPGAAARPAYYTPQQPAAYYAPGQQPAPYPQSGHLLVQHAASPAAGYSPSPAQYSPPPQPYAAAAQPQPKTPGQSVEMVVNPVHAAQSPAAGGGPSPGRRTPGAGGGGDTPRRGGPNLWPGPKPAHLFQHAEEQDTLLYWDEVTKKKRVPKPGSFKWIRLTVSFILEVIDPATDTYFLVALISSSCFEAAYDDSKYDFNLIRRLAMLSTIIGGIVLLSKLFDLCASYKGPFIQRLVCREQLRIALLREMSARESTRNAHRNCIAQAYCRLCYFGKYLVQLLCYSKDHILVVFFPFLRFFAEDCVQLYVTLVHVTVIGDATVISYVNGMTSLLSLFRAMVRVGIQVVVGERTGARRVLADKTSGCFTRCRARMTLHCNWLMYAIVVVYAVALFAVLAYVVVEVITSARDKERRC